jgi:hypothetical protein
MAEAWSENTLISGALNFVPGPHGAKFIYLTSLRALANKRVFVPRPRRFNLLILGFLLCGLAGRKHKWSNQPPYISIFYLHVFFDCFFFCIYTSRSSRICFTYIKVFDKIRILQKIDLIKVFFFYLNRRSETDQIRTDL